MGAWTWLVFLAAVLRGSNSLSTTRTSTASLPNVDIIMSDVERIQYEYEPNPYMLQVALRQALLAQGGNSRGITDGAGVRLNANRQTW